MSRSFSQRFVKPFVEILSDEVGQKNLSLMLEKAGLPAAWANARQFPGNEQTAIEAYAGLQQALRTYYGRGARGILQRTGSLLWKRLLEESPLTTQVHAAFVRRLPLLERPKAALELLAGLMSIHPGDVTVHTLDLDLLLADHASPGAPSHSSGEAICFVTLGLLHECLFWATSNEYDIQETSCKAVGQETCEFTIKTGG
ncbi:MAG: hypothetical protein Fur0043_10780 [Anaerolineales bacterium]